MYFFFLILHIWLVLIKFLINFILSVCWWNIFCILEWSPAGMWEIFFFNILPRQCGCKSTTVCSVLDHRSSKLLLSSCWTLVCFFTLKMLTLCVLENQKILPVKSCSVSDDFFFFSFFSHYFYLFIKITSWVASLIYFWISLESSSSSNTSPHAYIKPAADQRAAYGWQSVSLMCNTCLSFLCAVNNKVRNKHTMEQLKRRRNSNAVPMWITQFGGKKKKVQNKSVKTKGILCAFSTCTFRCNGKVSLLYVLILIYRVKTN